MNHVVVNDLKVVDIKPVTMIDEAGEKCAVIPFESAHNILDAWMQQDPSRRGFRYGGGVDDTEPCTVVIMWIANDGLVVQDLDPFWSPSTDTVNGYDLDVLGASLPVDALKYGAMIGEEL